MPLVGVIEVGTVPQILRSVSFAKANVLVLVARDQEFGHVEFEHGTITSARVGELDGEAALAAVEKWDSGQYTLIRRGGTDDTPRSHVLLVGLERLGGKDIEQWLTKRGCVCSVVAFPEHALRVIQYLEPDMVLSACPRSVLGMTCTEVKAELASKMGSPPAWGSIESTDAPCNNIGPDCWRHRPTEQAIEALVQRVCSAGNGEQTASLARASWAVKPSGAILAAGAKTPPSGSPRVAQKRTTGPQREEEPASSEETTERIVMADRDPSWPPAPDTDPGSRRRRPSGATSRRRTGLAVGLAAGAVLLFGGALVVWVGGLTPNGADAQIEDAAQPVGTLQPPTPSTSTPSTSAPSGAPTTTAVAEAPARPTAAPQAAPLPPTYTLQVRANDRRIRCRAHIDDEGWTPRQNIPCRFLVTEGRQITLETSRSGLAPMVHTWTLSDDLTLVVAADRENQRVVLLGDKASVARARRTVRTHTARRRSNNKATPTTPPPTTTAIDEHPDQNGKEVLGEGTAGF